MAGVESDPKPSPSASVPVVVAVLLLIIFYLRLSPAGPWGEPKFTNGVVGTSALAALYVSWYRFTFRRGGVLIPVRELQQPKVAGVKAGVFSLFCIFSAHAFGGSALLPGASGLVVMVIGLLGILQSLYLLTMRDPPMSPILEEA